MRLVQRRGTRIRARCGRENKPGEGGGRKVWTSCALGATMDWAKYGGVKQRIRDDQMPLPVDVFKRLG